tara:strand:+ start:3596 stop:3889 length:294 start_codon:yes stop_codon:yes gene_type:complete
MDKQVEEYYDKPLFGELLTITKTGIVNTCQILIDPKHEQLIHGGKLFYSYYTRLWVMEEGDFTTPTHEEVDIKIYNAVYYNGIQVVRKGKLFIGSGL